MVKIGKPELDWKWFTSSLQDIKKNKVRTGNPLARLATVDLRIFYFSSFLNWLDVWAMCRNRLSGKVDRTFLFIVCSGFGLVLALQASDYNPSQFLVLTATNFFSNREPPINIRCWDKERLDWTRLWFWSCCLNIWILNKYHLKMTHGCGSCVHNV
jgi:hypothetical protein